MEETFWKEPRVCDPVSWDGLVDRTRTQGVGIGSCSMNGHTSSQSGWSTTRDSPTRNVGVVDLCPTYVSYTSMS